MPKIKVFVELVKSKFFALYSRYRGFSRKKKIVVIIVVIILIALMLRAVNSVNKDPGYTLAIAEVGEVNELVSESGNIISSNRTDIYSPTNGVVTKVYVNNGQFIEKDEILFEVVSSATEQEKKQAESNYLAAVSALNIAQANADTLQSAMFSEWQEFKDTAESDQYENSDGTPKYDQRVESEFHIAEKNWTAAEKNYQNAQTVITQAQANVNSTRLLFDATKDSKVKATADGVIENISVGSGSAVTINQILAPVKPVMTVVGNAPVEVVISLGESDIVKIKPGHEAVLDVAAVDEKEYKGEVLRVDTVGTQDSGVVRYSIYVRVIDPDNLLWPGMSVDADIKTKSIEGVLVVPNSAIKPYQGGRAVRIPTGKGEFEFVPVKTGVKGTSYTEILSGIEVGQEVITALSNESIERPGLF